MTIDPCTTTGLGATRRRTVSWHDPAVAAAAALTMSGIEYLRAIRRGRVAPPPVAGVVLIKLCEVEHGRVVFSCCPDESMLNTAGCVHGGVLCTLLDTVAGCALMSTLPPGKVSMSAEIKVSYLKAVRPDGRQLTAIGTVRKAGSRLGFAEGVVSDASGAVVATASSTLLVADL